jgi:hypothetical protein
MWSGRLIVVRFICSYYRTGLGADGRPAYASRVKLTESMKLTDAELLPGERRVLTKRANAIVSPTDYGLERFPYDKHMGLVGMKDREAIGGKLHLTTARLVFKAHRINRLTGSMSIFLPSVVAAADTSHRVTRKVRIDTPSQAFEFVMWGIEEFLTALESQRAALGEEQRAELVAAIREHPEALGGGLEVSRKVDQLFGGRGSLVEVVEDLGGDAGIVASLVNLADLLYDA